MLNILFLLLNIILYIIILVKCNLKSIKENYSNYLLCSL